MANGFHQLSVTSLARPVKDALTIGLRVSAALKATFSYHPGQHLVFRFVLDGEEYRRSYSLNSYQGLDEELRVTVKRVPGGKISNHLNDNLRVGDQLEVMAPTGRFFIETDPRNYRTIFLFAAGSGITPIFSILRAVLHAEPYSNVLLFYGNRNKSGIIFREELEELENEYDDRLQVVHTFSEPYSDWSALWEWKMRKGIVDAEAVEWFITEHPPRAVETQYFICGPGNMNPTVKASLMALGIEAERIHYEHFGVVKDAPAGSVEGVENARVHVQLNGEQQSVNVSSGETILQAMKSAGLTPPYSCESGTCGTCVARVRKGKVGMKHCFALEDEEIAKGMVLTCQGIPQSEDVDLVFEA